MDNLHGSNVAMRSGNNGSSQAPSPAIALFVKRKSGRLADQEAVSRPSISYGQDAWLRLRKNKVAMASGVFVILLLLAALVIPEVLPYSYDEQEIWNKHALPTLGEPAYVLPEDGVPYEPLTNPAADPLAATGDAATEASGAGAVMTEPPPSPANVRLLGEALTTGVAIGWDAVPGAEGYRVYRSIADDTLGVPIEDVQPQNLSILDTASLATGHTYYYFVTAFNAFGDSTDPKPLKVEPKLAVSYSDAQKVRPDAQPGSTIQTNAHLLGTDYLGRDLLARVMIGARVSLLIGFCAPLLYVLFGIIYGSISGYFGGGIDDVMMRVTDIFSTVPELLVVILLQVTMGAGLGTLIAAMVIVSWSRSARQIRGEVLRLREMEFVHAANVLGTSFRKTVTAHLVPNVMGTVLVITTLAIPQAIFTEAFLSFIGLGIQPPMASWGIVTKEGARVFLTYPHELIIPSVLICVTMLAFNLFGDGLRDALDPKLRGAK